MKNCGGTKCNDVHHQGTTACFCGSHGGGEWQTWPGWRPAVHRPNSDADQDRPASCAPTALQPAYCPAPACSSIGLQSGATLPLPSTAVQRIWATGRSMWRPGPAMSWQARGVRRGPRLMFDTSRQVTRPSRAEISVYSANQGEKQHRCVYARSTVVKLAVSMHEISGSNPDAMHIFSKTFCTDTYVYM